MSVWGVSSVVVPLPLYSGILECRIILVHSLHPTHTNGSKMYGHCDGKTLVNDVVLPAKLFDGWRENLLIFPTHLCDWPIASLGVRVALQKSTALPVVAGNSDTRKSNR